MSWKDSAGSRVQNNVQGMIFYLRHKAGNKVEARLTNGDPGSRPDSRFRNTIFNVIIQQWNGEAYFA